MNIGIVSWWFNRGQATVARHVRSALAELGHRTVVLARPTKDSFTLPRFVSQEDVWDQPSVTRASRSEIPWREYESWVRENELDVVFFDQNYQLDEIARLRSLGIRTIGRFVWEQFSPRHVEAARRAFDIVYSLTRCEQERYREEFGIETPYVPWGCHPELVAPNLKKRSDAIWFFYPGGYLRDRKPTRAVIEAFSRTSRDDIRLIIKCQQPLRQSHLGSWPPLQKSPWRKGPFRPRDPRIRVEELNPRIELNADDLAVKDYYELVSSCHVCLAPSRWEGLGLHFYEALAFGLPIVTNDAAPMNETVRHMESGLLVRSEVCGVAKSGIAAHEPNVESLRAAIEAAADDVLRAQLVAGTESLRAERSWKRTVEGYGRLLEP
jgi:glycosyltransferase involved in cell wall biosynthesis